jgi:predicted nucleic acid-binding Zn ribbon protein
MGNNVRIGTDVYNVRLNPQSSNNCIICGNIIPEGRQVCPLCEREVNNDNHNAESK